MNKRIRFGDFQFGQDAIDLLTQVMQTGRISYGPLLREVEAKLAALHDVEYAIFMASGTCALQVGLRALKEIRGWPDDAEVIIPATTFIATMSSVLDASLVPVLIDVDPDTFCMDPTCIADAITDQTAAVLPVHLLGQPANMTGIMRVANKFNLDIVEDCCEAIGVQYKNQPVGSFGSFGAISTYVCHHVTSGVGGAVLTDDAKLAEIARSLIQFGRDPAYLSIDDDALEVVEAKYRFQRWGYSYRATELNAAVLLPQLERFEELKNSRIRTMSNLNAALQNTLLQTPKFSLGAIPLFYPIVLPGMPNNCAKLVVAMEKAGIETRPLMPLINQKPVLEYLPDLMQVPPVADRLIREAFLIGCHPGMSDSDIQRVGDTVHEFFA